MQRDPKNPNLWIADSADEVDQVRTMNEAASGPNVAAERPPPPDAGPGWKWQPGTNSWVLDPAQQSAHDQWASGNSLMAAGNNYAQNAPTLDQAQQALGTENIADKRFGQQNGTAGGQPLPTVDQSNITDARATRDQALADQRRVLEKSLNLGIDPTEQKALQQRFQERMIAGANTVAANARGGAGAVAAARQQVINQTPALAGQAAEQARSEELQLFNSRVQAAQTAGGIASTIGQTATGAFGQEAGLATQTAQIGLQAIDRINAETGMKIAADQQQQQLLGTMLQDVWQLGVNYAQLDVGTQEKVFDEIAASHHIDQQTAGQLKAIAKQKQKGVMDYVMGGLGAAEGVANTAAKFAK
jgi:hypothetical protein